MAFSGAGLLDFPYNKGAGKEPVTSLLVSDSPVEVASSVLEAQISANELRPHSPLVQQTCIQLSLPPTQKQDLVTH